MKLLTNCGSADHLAELRRCFLHADEITVLVAYLSKHGLDSLAPSLAKASKRAKSIEFFCGLDGCITDPEALRSLSRLLKSKPGTKHKLFLVETAASTFHPKVYQFKSSGSLRVVIGSANLTGGGLEQNWEASLVLEGKEGDAILNELSSYRTEVLQIAKEVTETRISQYARRHRIVSGKRRAADRAAQREAAEVQDLDLEKLEEYLQKYRNDPEGEKTFGRRVANYRDAKKILNSLAIGEAQKKAEFIRLFGQLAGYAGEGSLWWSQGLQRSRTTIDSHYRTVIDMIRAIRKNAKKPPAEAFRVAQPFVAKVRGLGVSTATEIMNTYAPMRLPVLNENPLAGLVFFGCDRFKDANAFTPEDYSSFTSIMDELRRACGFRSMAKADHFLNFIYLLKAKKRKVAKKAKTEN